MTWDIRFNRDGVEHSSAHPTAESAIEAACLLIDEGCVVYGIGSGFATDSIGEEEIVRICDLRSAAKVLAPSGTVSLGQYSLRTRIVVG
jgi:hypothetical protein